MRPFTRSLPHPETRRSFIPVMGQSSRPGAIAIRLRQRAINPLKREDRFGRNYGEEGLAVDGGTLAWSKLLLQEYGSSRERPAWG